MIVIVGSMSFFLQIYERARNAPDFRGYLSVGTKPIPPSRPSKLQGSFFICP